MEVAVVILLLALPAAVILAMAGLSPVRAVRGLLTLLLLYGLWKGHPLAWTWARFLAGLAAVLAGWSAVAGLIAFKPSSYLLPVASLGAAYLTAMILLGSDRSREFFGMRCPSCGNLRTARTNIFFTVHLCKACGMRWAHSRARPG